MAKKMVRGEPGDEDGEDEDGTCAGWEIVCPDGRVRDYPYHNHDDAEDMAHHMSARRCRLYPKPSPIELSQPPCPEGLHTIRPISFVCPADMALDS